MRLEKSIGYFARYEDISRPHAVIASCIRRCSGTWHLSTVISLMGTVGIEAGPTRTLFCSLMPNPSAEESVPRCKTARPQSPAVDSRILISCFCCQQRQTTYGVCVCVKGCVHETSIDCPCRCQDVTQASIPQGLNKASALDSC